MKTAGMTFYFSTTDNNVFQIPKDKFVPGLDKFVVSEFEARRLIAGLVAGKTIYVDETEGAAAQPKLWMEPVKPLVDWFQYAEQEPFQMIKGKPQRNWIVQSLDITQQLEYLADLRWRNVQQDSIMVGDVVFSTNDETYDRLSVLALGIGRTSPETTIHWKKSSIEYIEVKAAIIAEAFDLVEKARQRHRSIEAHHGGLVLKGTPSKIINWNLPEEM